MRPRTSPSRRIRLASAQAPIDEVTEAERTMNIAPRPTAYTSPGPPMKAKPESVADMAESASASSPIPSPATKKSRPVRVRRVAQAPIAATTAK